MKEKKTAFQKKRKHVNQKIEQSFTFPYSMCCRTFSITFKRDVSFHLICCSCWFFVLHFVAFAHVVCVCVFFFVNPIKYSSLCNIILYNIPNCFSSLLPLISPRFSFFFPLLHCPWLFWTDIHKNRLKVNSKISLRLKCIYSGTVEQQQLQQQRY